MNSFLSFAVSIIFITASFFMKQDSYWAVFLFLGIIFAAIAVGSTTLRVENFYKTLGEPAYKRIILAGPAGSGKDYLRDGFMEKGFSVDVSCTTRPMREGEVEGETYNYITEERFQHLQDNDKFYESVSFNGAHYGTLRESWENAHIFIMTPSGITHITEADRKDCIIVYLNIAESVRRERMQKRSDGGFDKIERRIEADNADFTNFFYAADVIIMDPMFDRDFMIKAILDKAEVYADQGDPLLIL